MIYIYEDDKRSLSGLTSLYLLFEFSQDIVNIVKSSGTYCYHKDSHTWEVPLTSLSYLIDNLCYYDEISLFVKANDENRHLETLKCEHRTKLYDYQKEGVEFGLNHDKWLLLDSPGLGKTLQMITLAEELKEQRGIKHCLVICGIASLRDNWRKEIQKHSMLDCVLIGERINRNNNRVWEKIPKRAEQLRNKIDEFFVIINVESLRYDEIVTAILEGENKFDMIILDECHKCVDGDTLVDTTLGKLSIKYIVDNHLDCKVKSYNSKTKSFEFNNILNYYNNGSLSMIQLEILDEKGKLHTIMCTEEHKIYTLNRGWVCAKNLNINEDEIFLC